jgi:hypothetical protein
LVDLAYNRSAGLTSRATGANVQKNRSSRGHEPALLLALILMVLYFIF